MVSFASGFNFYKLFWVFFIGCFLGVIIETIWCILRLHHYESRKGLVYGPFNPVYGFGALMMTLCLSHFDGERDLWIFLMGSFIGGVYEYVCSYMQEKLLGTVSWDYKNFPLNLHGRINLLYCFFWGILALLWVKDLYPHMSHMIEKIPNSYGIALTWILFVFMIFNAAISFIVVYRMNQRQVYHEKIRITKFWAFIDSHFPDERVRKIYPNMKFNHNNKKA